ncbi:hypothetical protein [Nocardioides sp. LML1-1-1.1]|uniref:hypothetical protein n=1 Tax=Nocardioides sp. LML1-1-1.1 TaxID=3135248 RepID=UPI00342D7522
MAFEELDTAPLTAAVDPADVPARTARELGSDLGGWLVVNVLLWLVLGLVAVGLSFLPPRPWWAAAPAGLGAVVSLGLLVSALRPRAEHRARPVRLARFAAANDMTYTPRPGQPAEGPGLVLGTGTGRHTRDLVEIAVPREIQLGRQHYFAGRGNAEARAWSYATTPLTGPGAAGLPHLVLTARGRWNDAALPGSSDSSLGTPGLSGPGAAAYLVRGPIGQAPWIERVLDVTLFRPDVLARLTERPVHVEVVDRRLYLYVHGPLVTLDPDTWRWILPLVVDVATALEAAPVS